MGMAITPRAAPRCASIGRRKCFFWISDADAYRIFPERIAPPGHELAHHGVDDQRPAAYVLVLICHARRVLKNHSSALVSPPGFSDSIF
jgi:hypothetical protein